MLVGRGFQGVNAGTDQQKTQRPSPLDALHGMNRHRDGF
jgi:hypothetical protein